MASLASGRDDIYVGRIISEDGDKVLIEVGKTDDVSWQVGGMPEDERPPDRFLTMLFIRQEDGKTVPWHPFR